MESSPAIEPSDIELLGVFSLPLRVPFRGILAREVALISGKAGFGEWAAFTEYPDNEASFWLASAIEQASFTVIPSTELTSVPVNAIVPHLSLEEIAGWCQQFAGFKSVKMKVGHPGVGLAEDVARIRELSQCFPSDTTIRIDANGSWTVDQAYKILQELEKLNIDYIEQPVGTLEELLALKKRTKGLGVRLAADELVRQRQTLNGLSLENCDVIVLKPSSLGGYHRSIQLAKIALGRDLEVVVSSGLESSVGLSHVSKFALWLNEYTGLENVHGLATQLLFERDLVHGPMEPSNGRLSLTPVDLDWGQLAELAVPYDREVWWRERFERCVPKALPKLLPVAD